MRIRKDFKIKKTILLIFTFLTMLGVCSCATKNEKEKKKQTDQEVVACIDDENFNKIQEDNFRDYRKLGTAYQKVY